jgi:hypothetical protein
MTMTELIDEPPRQLAYRANGGIEVTLLWHPPTDQLRVCVCDERHGGYFEVLPEPHQALDAFYHPYAYVSSSSVHYEGGRLAA